MSQVRTEGPSDATETPTACWQPGFLKLLPMIERHARYYFRTIHDDEALEEAVQEVICSACVAYALTIDRADVLAVKNSTDPAACPTSKGGNMETVIFWLIVGCVAWACYRQGKRLGGRNSYHVGRRHGRRR